MKLENKYIEIEGGIGEESYDASISQSDMHKMWDMLQNPYKNSIGSIVREVVSNCFDSHTEAGITDAVRVKFGKEDSGFYVSFIDVGVGLSPDRIKDIFLKYLKSTKELSNEFIGAFGLGSKSPLSYNEFFYINTRFEGIEYNYMMYKGETSPKVDLLTKSNTTERNGTEIKLIIKNESDLYRFLTETYNQLHYFQNVVLDTDDLLKLYEDGYGITRNIKIVINKIQQDYRLIEGTNFICRTNTDKVELHLCIGNVMYPIDWNNLKDINRINLPLALKFNIGELPVIQTREDIRYNDKTIRLIKDKILLLLAELTEIKKNQALTEFDSFHDFMKNGETKLNNSNLTLGNDEFQLSFKTSGYIDENVIPAMQIKGFPYVFKSNKELRNFLGKLDNDFISRSNYKHDDDFIARNVSVEKTFNSIGALTFADKLPFTSYNNKQNVDLYSCNPTILSLYKYIDPKVRVKLVLFKVRKDWNPSTKKNRYIQEVLYKDTSPDEMYIVQVKDRFNFSKKMLKKLIKHFDFPKENIKDVLKFIFKDLESKLKPLFVDYDSIVVDELWWKKRQLDNKKEVDYDRTLMAIEKYDVNGSSSGSWDRKDFRINLEDYITNHDIRILITKEEQKKHSSNNNDYFRTPLEKLAIVINTLKTTKYLKHNVRIDATSQRNYDKILKYRNEKSNIFTLEEFFKDEKMQTRILSKLVTVLKIKQTIDNHHIFKLGRSFKEIEHTTGLLNEELEKDYRTVLDAINNTYINMNVSDIESLIADIDDLTLKTNLYDKDLLSKFDNFMEFLSVSKFNMIEVNASNFTAFVCNYVPVKFGYRLNNIFNKADITEEYLILIYRQLFTDRKIIKEDILRDFKSFGRSFGYSSVLDNVRLFMLLLLKKEYNTPYTPLLSGDLSLNLTKEVAVVEVVEEEEFIEDFEII